MALEIFKLFGSIFVDNEKANESIAKTDKKAQGVGQTLLKGVGAAAKWGAGIATAAGAGVTAITGLASKFADTTGAIADSSAKVGLTAEAYQQYAYAAKLSGIETSKLESLMVKSQKSFADAKEGSKSLSEAYQRLGVDISSIDNSSDAFDATITALAGMADETERNALANDIFGKSYADLAPLLNEGADGIARLKQEAIDMGAVMSNEAVAAGEQFGDTMDKIKMAGAGLFNQLGTAVLPVVQQFADMILANLPTIQSMFAQLAPVIAMVFTNLLPPIMQLVETLLPTLMELFNSILPIVTQIISEVLPIFTELLGMLLPPLTEIVKALLPPLLEIVQALMPVLQLIIDMLRPIIGLFTSLITPIVDLAMTAIKPLIDILTSLITSVLEPIMPIIEALAKVLTSVLGAAFKGLKPIINNYMGYLKGLIDFITGVFTGNWKKAFEGLKAIVKNVFEAMVNIVKTPINWIIKGLNAFIDGLNKIKIPDWVPLVGGKGINIPTIPLLAKGGTVYEAGKVIVGDAGPEILDLPAGAKVTPLQGNTLTSKDVIDLLKMILAALTNSKDTPVYVENDIYFGDDKVLNAVKRAQKKQDKVNGYKVQMEF